MRKYILLSLLTTLIVVIGVWLARDFLHDQLFDLTGESEALKQARGLLQYLSNYTRPAPQTDDFAAVAQAGVSPFGVNTFLQLEVEPVKRERQMQMIHEAGFRWIRQEFTWEDIEISGKGDFWDHKFDKDAWEKYDHIVDLAEKYDVQIIARLSNPPAWTRALTNTIGAQAPPDDFHDYGDFVETVVRRYKGRVHTYQLWNEPNIYPEWGDQPVDPVGYTELLCEGYRRAKAVDPDLVILSGALAQTIALDGHNVNDLIFLQQMYAAGAGDCFDVLSTQGYSLWSAPTDHRMRPQVMNYGRIEYIRDVMVQNGDAHKAIWISEMNSNAVPTGPERVDIADWGSFGQVTPEEQAQWATLAYQRAQQEWPYVGVINVWFFKLADESQRNQAMYYFRLLDPDFTPQPIYEALQDYANRPPRMYPGTHQEDHWAVTWAGEWTDQTSDEAMLGRYKLAGQNATARVCVEGDQFEIVRAPGSDKKVRLTVEKGDDGCRTLYAELGVAIDGFVLQRESNTLWKWVLFLLVSGAASVQGFWLWRKRTN